MSEKVFGHRAKRRVYALLGALVLAGGTVGVAACGDDDDDDGGDGGAAATGGEITMAQTSQPDYLDPALGYTVNAIEPFFATYLPPYTFPHVEGEAGTEVIPGLADAPVEISEDGLTYSFTFRDGIKYSDGTDLKASDWEHAIKRVLNLESGGSSFFLYIDGATEYVEKGDPEGDISGIETNDKTGEVTITLAEPYAPVQLRADDVVRDPGSERHAVREPDRGTAAQHRPVHDHRVGPEPAVRAGEEPRVRPDRRGARGQPGQDDHRDHQGPGEAVAGRDQQRARLHAGPARCGPQAAGDRAASARTVRRRSGTRSSRPRPRTTCG